MNKRIKKKYCKKKYRKLYPYKRHITGMVVSKEIIPKIIAKPPSIIAMSPSYVPYKPLIIEENKNEQTNQENTRS